MAPPVERNIEINLLSNIVVTADLCLGGPVPWLRVQARAYRVLITPRRTLTVSRGRPMTVSAASVVTDCRSVNPFTVHSSPPVDGSVTSTDAAAPSAKVTACTTRLLVCTPFTRYNRLYNRFDNRLYRVIGALLLRGLECCPLSNAAFYWARELVFTRNNLIVFTTSRELSHYVVFVNNGG